MGKYIIFLTITLFTIFYSSISISATTSYQYDNLHRLSRVEHSNGTTVVYNYDNVGNRTSKVVSVGPIIDAQFTSDLTNGFAPLQVTFTDQSVGNITSWLWVFGDGQTSSEQHPVHSYVNPGTYTVSLTVSGPDGSDTIDIADYITVGTNPGSPVISIDPTLRSVIENAGSTTFTVENVGTGTMNWTATSGDSWLSILGGTSGTDSGTITVSYEENTGAERTGTINITSPDASNSPQAVEVIQAEGSRISIEVLYPVEGEVLNLGSAYDIEWAANSPNGIDEIRIYYHYSGNVLNITDLSSNPGLYSWTVPSSAGYMSENARIRIVAVDGLGNSSESYSSYFSVQDSSVPPHPWTAPDRLTTTEDPGTYVSVYNTNSALAVDNLGNVHLVYRYTKDEYSPSTPRRITQKIFYQKKINGSWLAPEEIFSLTETSADNNLPGYMFSNFRIAVDSNNFPHISWVYEGPYTADCTGFNDDEIYYIGFNGTTWDPPVNVSNNGTRSNLSDIAIDSNNNIHFVWGDGRTYLSGGCSSTGSNALYHRIRKSDGTWSVADAVIDTDYYGTYPAIAKGPTGSIHLAFSTSGAVEYVFWDGTSWSDPTLIIDQGDDYYWKDIDADSNGNVHLVYDVWGNFGNGNVHQIRHTVFDGSSWSIPEVVSIGDNGYGKTPVVALSPQGFPQVVWYEDSPTIAHIYYKQKTPYGWSSTVQLSTAATIPQEIGSNTLSADIFGDDIIHVTWQAYYESGYEVYYTYADVMDDQADPFATIKSPLAGASLTGGAVVPIYWEAVDNTGIADIRLEYTIDGGSTLTTIIDSTNNSGSFGWTVPDIDNDTVQVFLTATDISGNQSVAASGIFEINSSPPDLQAEFASDVNIGATPLDINFTDQSTGNISSWLWVFGDGSSSTLQNPVHTYNQTGSYTVSLTINGPDGSDTETKTNYIIVSDNDSDEDGVIDALDNCPVDYNPDQLDSDGNGYGDVCDHEPIIPSANPIFVILGMQVTISGQYFGTQQGTSTLSFTGTTDNINIISWSDNSITFTIPENSVSGCVKVTTQYGESSCFNISVFSSDSVFLFSGSVNGIPSISAGYSSIGLNAVETSGANLGNRVSLEGDGSYQMALFPGMYDISIVGSLSEQMIDEYTYFSIYENYVSPDVSEGYVIDENVTIEGDQTRDYQINLHELTGVVTDTNGVPIPGVDLTSNTSSVAYCSTKTSAVPGSVGMYKLYFLPGDYELKVDPPDGSRFGKTSMQVTVTGNQSLNIVLDELNLLTVMVSGIPSISAGYSSIGLNAVETSGANLGNRVTLEGDGSYQMALFPGTYDISIVGSLSEQIIDEYTYFSIYENYVSPDVSEGYVIDENVTIEGDQTRDYQINLHELTGVVTDTNGVPIPGVDLTSNTSSVAYCSTKTSADPGSVGMYKLYFLPGDYELKIDPPDGSRFGKTSMQVTITGNQSLNIVLDELNLLTGMVSGIPSISAGYSSIGLNAVETSGANLGNRVTLEGDGSYQMALFPGTYDISIVGSLSEQIIDEYTYFSIYENYVSPDVSEGYVVDENVTIEGNQTRDYQINLHELTGVVTDTNGVPISGVDLTSNTSSVAYCSTKTSADPGSVGMYKLYFLPGVYKLKISAPPGLYPPFEIKQLHITGNTTRNIVLSYDYQVLEDAIAAIAPSLELYLDIYDIIDQGMTKSYDVPVTASRDQIQMIVNWDGSEMRASIFKPDGSLFGEYQSSTPPIIVDIPNPEVGTWKCDVTAIDIPHNNYPIAFVVAIDPNEIPTANANGPYSGFVGDPITFDATGSQDPDGDIVRYDWDWNNDGLFDETTNQSTIAHTWFSAYTGNVALKVTDDEGITATSYAYVEVTDPGPIDGDGDGIDDTVDNCQYVYNPHQADFDGDGAGDFCDGDDDNDGMPDWFENTYGLDPFNAYDAQFDPDDDGFATIQEFYDQTDPTDIDSRSCSICRSDFNFDGIVDELDLDMFSYEFGTANCSGSCGCDTNRDDDVDGNDLLKITIETGRSDCDQDEDGWPDGSDNCPCAYNPEQTDSDGNQIGDACQMDGIGQGYQWIPLPSMNYERSGKGHLLQDGRVLIVGGQTQSYMYNDQYTIAESEIFAPTTRTFSITGSLVQKRCSPGITSLSDGKVLIFGGSGGSIFPEFSSVEIYDPTIGEYSFAGNMSTNRIYQPPGVRLPNGDILIIGGAYEGSYGNTTNSIDRYNINTGEIDWNVGQILIPRSMHITLLLPDGNIYILGGGLGNGQGNADPAVEIYNPITNHSTFPAEQPAGGPGGYSAAYLPNGKIIMKSNLDNYPEIYDPVSGTYQQITSMGTFTVNPYREGLLPFNIDKALFIGEQIRLFNPATEELEHTIEWPEIGCNYHGISLIDGRVLFINRTPGCKPYILSPY